MSGNSRTAAARQTRHEPPVFEPDPLKRELIAKRRTAGAGRGHIAVTYTRTRLRSILVQETAPGKWTAVGSGSMASAYATSMFVNLAVEIADRPGPPPKELKLLPLSALRANYATWFRETMMKSRKVNPGFDRNSNSSIHRMFEKWDQKSLEWVHSEALSQGGPLSSVRFRPADRMFTPELRKIHKSGFFGRISEDITSRGDHLPAPFFVLDADVIVGSVADDVSSAQPSSAADDNYIPLEQAMVADHRAADENKSPPPPSFDRSLAALGPASLPELDDLPSASSPSSLLRGLHTDVMPNPAALAAQLLRREQRDHGLLDLEDCFTPERRESINLRQRPAGGAKPRIKRKRKDSCPMFYCGNMERGCPAKYKQKRSVTRHIKVCKFAA